VKEKQKFEVNLVYFNLDVTMDERLQSSLNDSSLRKRNDSDSIVRGILSNSIQYNHEKQTGDSPSALTRLLNGNSDTPRIPKSNQVPLSPEAIQQQHNDFTKKYRSAKAKLESQLEQVRTQEGNDITKRNTILNKLSQLENIKNKHLQRTVELKRQTQQTTTNVSVNNIEQKDLMNNLFTSSSPKSMDNNNPSTFYQRNSPPIYRPSSLQFDSGQTPSSSSYMPVNNSPSSFNPHSTTYPY